MRFCIAVTGLPGSGKTTVGQAVAQQLHLPFLDKDDFLDTLFTERGIGDQHWRQALSRESDGLFQRAAQREQMIVLVSHWRPKAWTIDSGTPIAWLSEAYPRIVELYCHCPVDEAARRFRIRKRHPGHRDEQKTADQIKAWLNDYAQHLPLGLGTQITANTHPSEPLEPLLNRIRDWIRHPPSQSDQINADPTGPNTGSHRAHDTL